uniref:Uncharacterized protein n=1 Tax=Tanacetum cinerariifolium TaxID=118510 RepID=A0A699L6K2_TANCI|nr:hypothetical protein [Tanacetum cinerariifolium]
MWSGSLLSPSKQDDITTSLVSDLKNIDLSAEALAALKIQVPSIIDNYLGSKVRDVFQMELKKHTANLIQKYSLQQIPELPKKQKTTVDLEQGSKKILIEDENTIDKGVADIIQDHKRKHDDDEDDEDEDPSAGPKQVEEPIVEVVMDDASDDANSPEGDHYPFDMSKPLPLQGHPGHLTVTANYFFNNDLEYLKSSDPERTYTMSIMKTKAAQYKIKGIEDMVPTLWSPTKVGYVKDALKGIKHLGEGQGYGTDLS